MSKKFVLCRPEAGLNDVLCQISICADYAVAENRILIVDTKSTECFADDFDAYFTIEWPGLEVRYRVGEDLVQADLTVFPPHATLCLGEVKPAYVKGLNFCFGGRPLTFDFGKTYVEDVLVHHQFGGGSPSTRLLRSLRLSPALLTAFFERWRDFPHTYTGFQVRNTDMESDFLPVLEKMRNQSGPIFLATDSAAVQERARDLQKNKLHMSAIPDFNGRPIHYEYVDRARKVAINRTAILDLLFLACANRLYVSTEQSGYARLALRLNRKPLLALRWFQRDTWPRGRHKIRRASFCLRQMWREWRRWRNGDKYS